VRAASYPTPSTHSQPSPLPTPQSHLEREPDVERVAAQLLDGLVARAADDRAAHHGRLQQRRRLVLVDVAQHVQPDLLPLGLDVHHLAAHQAVGAAGARELRDDAQQALRGDALCVARDVLKGVGQHRVAGEDGHVLAVDLFWFWFWGEVSEGAGLLLVPLLQVARAPDNPPTNGRHRPFSAPHLVVGGAAAPKVVVVHRRQVVVDEAHGVDHLHRARGGHGGGGVAAHHGARGEAQRGAHALAAGQQRVAHRLVEGVRVLLGARAVQGGVDRRGGGLHVGLEVKGAWGVVVKGGAGAGGKGEVRAHEARAAGTPCHRSLDFDRTQTANSAAQLQRANAPFSLLLTASVVGAAT
jgi:hypothetical protein